MELYSLLIDKVSSTECSRASPPLSLSTFSTLEFKSDNMPVLKNNIIVLGSIGSEIPGENWSAYDNKIGTGHMLGIGQ